MDAAGTDQPDVQDANEQPDNAAHALGNRSQVDELEEGEQEDEGGVMDEDESDSDVDIILDRKDGARPPPPPDIRNIPQRSAATGSTVRPAPPPKKPSGPVAPSSSSVAVTVARQMGPLRSPPSAIDVNGNPMLVRVGKPITQVNIDEDFGEDEKPWRRPGTDMSDYFNYGFDEYTWALYTSKQESLRTEFNQDSIAANNKKMMEDFNMMMMGGMGMHGAGPATTGPAGPGAMPGLDTMPPEMQAMMQQMMATGMDPSQMDPSAMSAMFAGMDSSGAAAAAAQAGQGQNYGQSFGNQGQAFAYDQNMGGNQGVGGGPRARNRGGRRW